jgi:hypothetical protein
MGKYSDLLTAVFSVFDSTPWKDTNIKTFPSNYVAVNSGNEFLRVSVLPSGLGINPKSTAGLLLIDIFTPAGNGPNRAFALADSLDSFLVGKSVNALTGVVQCATSALSGAEKDSDNPTLVRARYTIPFSYFGE